jgi:hypothetical protein
MALSVGAMTDADALAVLRPAFMRTTGFAPARPKRLFAWTQCRTGRAACAILGDGRPQLETRNYLLWSFQVRDHVFAVGQLFEAGKTHFGALNVFARFFEKGD